MIAHPAERVKVRELTKLVTNEPSDCCLVHHSVPFCRGGKIERACPPHPRSLPRPSKARNENMDAKRHARLIGQPCAPFAGHVVHFRNFDVSVERSSPRGYAFFVPLGGGESRLRLHPDFHRTLIVYQNRRVRARRFYHFCTSDGSMMISVDMVYTHLCTHPIHTCAPALYTNLIPLHQTPLHFLLNPSAFSPKPLHDFS